MFVNFILHERSYNAVRFVRAEVLERYGVYHVHFGIVQYLVIAIALVERGRCDARSCGRHGLFAVISFVMLEDDLIVFQERLVYDNILRCFCKTIERDLHLGRAARYARVNVVSPAAPSSWLPVSGSTSVARKVYALLVSRFP